MSTAAALANAKVRASAGWPLALLVIALYSPLHGLPQLFLIGAGAFFLSRGAPAAPSSKPAPAKPANRPRNAEGKWMK